MTATLAHDLAAVAAPEARSLLLDNLLAHPREERPFVYGHLAGAQQRDIVRALGERYGRTLDEDLVETIRHGWLTFEAAW